MNLKNVFLNGVLYEEVFIKPPPGYNHLSDKVCHFCKALYELKQTLRALFAKLSSIISQFGLFFSSYDHALFIHKTERGCTMLLLYVDDIIITGEDIQGKIVS